MINLKIFCKSGPSILRARVSMQDEADCATMTEDTSTTCRLDAVLCRLTSQCPPAIGTAQRRRLPLSTSLQLFVNTHSHLMFADGPLALHHRHFIALLVRCFLAAALLGPFHAGRSGPLCHALSSSSSWTSMRRRRATVPLATSGEWA